MTETPRPAARRGRPPAAAGAGLTRERIIAAALALLDERGLEAFSVRDLARGLGVYPAAIYWRVPTRNALLAAMVAEVLAGIEPDLPPEPWQDWLRALFRAYRAAVRRHPNIAPVIGAQLVSNTGIDLARTEKLLAVLHAAGFRQGRLIAAFNVVIAAQLGFVTLEFAPAPAEDAAGFEAEMQALLGAVDAAAHPLLAAHLPRMANRSFTLRWQNGREVPLDAAFEAYVETVIAGLERLAAMPD